MLACMLAVAISFPFTITSTICNLAKAQTSSAYRSDHVFDHSVCNLTACQSLFFQSLWPTYFVFARLFVFLPWQTRMHRTWLPWLHASTATNRNHRPHPPNPQPIPSQTHQPQRWRWKHAPPRLQPKLCLPTHRRPWDQNRLVGALAGTSLIWQSTTSIYLRRGCLHKP